MEYSKPIEYRHHIKHDDGDGGFVVETIQDVTGIIDSNKEDMITANTKWGDDMFDNKVASIPMTIIDDLNVKGIMRGYHILDLKRFKAWLNNPDNRFFRTKPGRV